MYEFVSPVIATILMVAVKGGTNVITGEPFEGEMEINSQIGFNVNPASEMASDLMAEGLSVEEAKDKVVEFANGFDNVAGITKEDLFTKTIGEDLAEDNHKKAIEKSVLFNSLNNIKRMLIETVSSDADSVEDKKVNEVVRKSMATFIRNNGGAGANAIDNMVSETLDSIEKGGEISLTKVNDLAKRSTIAKTIDSQIARFKAISTEGSAFEKIAEVEVERIKIKSETAVIETIVKVEIDPSLEKDDRNNFITKVKEDKVAEVNESKKDFFAEKEAEKEAMKLKAQKMRRISQIDKEFYFDKKEELKAMEEYWERVKKDSEKLTVELIDSMIKGLMLLDAEVKSWYSEVSIENEEEGLGYDMKKFDAIIAHSNSLMTEFKEMRDKLSQEPGEPGEPGEPVVKAKLGEQEYYDHMKVRYDSFFDTYKDTYIDMSTTDANGVKSFWLGKVEEIVSHSVFTDYNDGANSSVRYLSNPIQQHMNELGVSYTYYAPMMSIIFALWEKSQWKNQIDKTYNLTLLGSLKSEIEANNNWRINNKNNYESKLSSGTLTDHNEIRNYLEALFYLEYGPYSLLNYIDEKIAKASESKYDEKQWVSIDDLKITLIDREFAKIDFKDSAKKASYEDGSYASKYEMSGVTVKLSDFDKNEEGSYIAQYGFSHNSSKGYSGLLSEVLFNGNKGQYITYMVARPNGEIDLVATQVSLSNGRVQWDYKIGGEMLFEDVWASVFGEGFIVHYKNGVSLRDSGVGTYWYFHKVGNTTETYPNWYKSQLSSSTSQGIGEEMFVDYQFYGKYKHSYNHSEEHGLRNIYSVNNFNSLSDNGKQVYAMNEYYRLSDYYSTRESLGIMTEELSGDLYAKSDKDGSYPKIYTFDGESYSLYNGYVYHKHDNNEVATTSEQLWRERYYVSYNICIGGQLLNNYRGYSNFGLTNIQGWKDCDGLERSKVMLANNSYFTNQHYTAEFGPEFKGWSLSMENLTGEKITVSLDDYDSYFDHFKKEGVDHTLGSKIIQYLASNQTGWGRYLWETNVDFENKVLSFKMVTSGYPRGLGIFGITTDVSGKFNYEQELCLDTDGDGVYDQIDGWPNDPAYSYDYDGDGLPDETDPFPYDIDPTYSILTDLINGGNFVIPTSMVKFLNGYSEFVYVIEDKAGPVVKALSFDGVSSTNDEGYPELALTSETRIYADEKMADHYGGAVAMAESLMSKYNEKGGEK